MQRFRGGLVFKAHRLLYHSTLGLGVINNKKQTPASWVMVEGVGSRGSGFGFRGSGLVFGCGVWGASFGVREGETGRERRRGWNGCRNSRS